VISSAREARPSWPRRLVARAAGQELSAFVVPGPEVARARSLDLGAAGLRLSDTPRHASVLVLVGGLPEGLKKAAAVAYAQMPRPRAIFAVGAGNVSPLPVPDVSVTLGQEAVADGVAELRRLFAEGAFHPEATDFDVDAIRARTEYVCPMHPEVVRDEPGSCPICGMDLVPREAAEGADHGGMDHGHSGGMDHDAEHGEMDHGEHEDHGHGDMGFMSMVEMTKDLPRSSDGLPMERVEAPFGPLFTGLPGGLALTLTLDGDTVAEVEVEPGVEGRPSPEDLTGPAEGFADRLARLDPLSPVAYRVLALRALEDAAGAALDERTALGRVGAVERERAASHLNWLASFGHLIGYSWFAARAAELQLALLRAEVAEELGRLRAQVGGFLRRAGRMPLLGRKLEGIGSLRPSDAAGASGPVARAGGVETDARAEERAYRGLGFGPVVLEGNDALSRLRVRLAEIERSLELVRAAGAISSVEHPIRTVASGAGTATVETPRGAATLTVAVEGGAVSIVELDTPSTRHLGLVKAVTEQKELADALVGVASLDLSPWEVVR
jgi:Ni,Fe-hydrogenase III large subunit